MHLPASRATRATTLGMLLALVVGACAPGQVPAAPAAPAAPAGAIATTPEELYAQLEGKPRDEQLAILERGAKQEGKLQLYASGAEERIRGWVGAFNAKYPYVEVQITRGSTRKIAERFITQARAGQPEGDLFFAGLETLATLRAEGLTARHVVPDGDRMPAELRNDHGHWTLTRLLSHHVAYNTKLTSPEKLPNDFDGFTAPEWQGKFAINSDASEWFICQIKARGQDGAVKLLRDLLANKPIVHEGKSALLERMTLGEFAANIDNSGSSTRAFVTTGAPVGIKSLDPICVTMTGGIVPVHSKSPNAAVLLLNFTTSAEVQTIFASDGYMPISADVPPADPAMRPEGARFVFLDESDLEPKRLKELEKLHSDIVLRGR